MVLCTVALLSPSTKDAAQPDYWDEVGFQGMPMRDYTHYFSQNLLYSVVVQRGRRSLDRSHAKMLCILQIVPCVADARLPANALEVARSMENAPRTLNKYLPGCQVWVCG